MKFITAEYYAIGIGTQGLPVDHVIAPVKLPGQPYWKGCAAAHAIAARLALTLDQPVLILEADATLREGAMQAITIPPDADAVYFGLSALGGEGGTGSTWLISEEYPDLVELKDMLATHAVMLISREFKERYLAEASDPARPFDIGVAKLQRRFKVYALVEPWFYQGPQGNPNAVHTDYSLVDAVVALRGVLKN